MKRHEALLCSDCEELYCGSVCPSCGDTNGFPIANWIKPLKKPTIQIQTGNYIDQVRITKGTVRHPAHQRTRIVFQEIFGKLKKILDISLCSLYNIPKRVREMFNFKRGVQDA